MLKSPSQKGLFGLLFATVSFSATAETLIFQLAGTISDADSVFTSVRSGDHWTATFSIPSYRPDSSPDPNLGKYHGLTGVINVNGSPLFSVDIGNFSNTFMHVGNSWTYVSPVYDFLDFNGDQTAGTPSSQARVDDQLIDFFEIGFGNWTGDALEDTSILGTLDVHSGHIEGSIFHVMSGSNQIYGFMDSISVTTTLVPLPAPALLLGSGILIMLSPRRPNAPQKSDVGKRGDRIISSIKLTIPR